MNTGRTTDDGPCTANSPTNPITAVNSHTGIGYLRLTTKERQDSASNATSTLVIEGSRAGPSGPTTRARVNTSAANRASAARA